MQFRDIAVPAWWKDHLMFLKKAESFLSLMWLLNQDKLSQTSKQDCITHLPSVLVTSGIQLYPAAQSPASHFPQKTVQLCQQHTGDKNLVEQRQDQHHKQTRAAVVHRSPAWGHPRAGAAGLSLSCRGSATSQLCLMKQQLNSLWLLLLFLFSEIHV